MKLMAELNEEVQIIKEDKDGEKKYFIEGIFLQGDIVNRNGRKYPSQVLSKEVKRYTEQYINKNRAFGELNHPQGPTINLDKVSHIIQELRADGANFIGRAKVMSTPMGNIVKSLMDEGAKLGVSSRGMGSLKMVGGVNEVQEDFWLSTAADIVADPSAPDAFVNGIMEGKEWVWDNGILVEREIAQIHHSIATASKKNLDEACVAAFASFLSKISKC